MAPNKKMIFLSLLISLALVLSYIEVFFPVPIPLPGVKLGLANIITLLTLLIFGLKETLLVVLLRTFLASALGGSPVTFLYSLSGGLSSVVVMYILYKKFSHYFSIPGISIVGAIGHNIGQLFIATLITRANLFYYFPILVVASFFTGLFIGWVVVYIKKTLDLLKS